MNFFLSIYFIVKLLNLITIIVINEATKTHIPVMHNFFFWRKCYA